MRRRVAETGFFLVLLAGPWLTAAQVRRLKFGAVGMMIAIAPDVGGLPLVITTHWVSSVKR